MAACVLESGSVSAAEASSNKGSDVFAAGTSFETVAAAKSVLSGSVSTSETSEGSASTSEASEGSAASN